MRALLLALVVANLLFLAWAQGWLAPSLPGPRASLGEPQRLANQVQPEWVQIVPAQGASDIQARKPGPACLEAGPLDAAGLTAAQAVLEAAALLVGRWAQTSDTDGRVWLRLDQADDALQAKLRALPAADLAGGFKPCRTS